MICCIFPLTTSCKYGIVKVSRQVKEDVVVSIFSLSNNYIFYPLMKRFRRSYLLSKVLGLPSAERASEGGGGGCRHKHSTLLLTTRWHLQLFQKPWCFKTYFTRFFLYSCWRLNSTFHQAWIQLTGWLGPMQYWSENHQVGWHAAEYLIGDPLSIL